MKASIFINVLLGSILTLSAAYMFSLAEDLNSDWIEVTNYEAVWLPKEGVIRQIATVKRIEGCPVEVAKTLRVLDATGTADGHNQIFLVEGSLKQKIESIPVGEERRIADDSRVQIKHQLAPGKYLLTVLIVCEEDQGLETGPVLKRADPIYATIEVHRTYPPDWGELWNRSKNSLATSRTQQP